MTDEKVEPLPPTPEEWHALPLEKRREIVESGSRSFMEAYDKENPGWLEAAGLRILWGALENLQHYLEDGKDPEITWESPILELQFTLPWDWSVGAPAIIEMPDAALRDTQSPSKWFAGVFLEAMNLEALKALTSGAAVRVRGGETETLISPDIQSRVDEMTEEEKDAFFADFGKPFVLGAEVLSDDEVEEWDEEDEDGEPVTLVSPTEAGRKRLEDLKPILTFHGDADGTPFSGSIIFAVHPLVVDEDKREAFYPVTVGLQFDPLEDHHRDLVARVPRFPDPGTWSSEDRATFWKGLLVDLRAWEEKLSRGEPVEPTPEGAAVPATAEEVAVSGASDTSTTSETATTSTMEVFRALDTTAVRVVAPSEGRTKFLTDSATRFSPEMGWFLKHTPRIRLPRKGASIPRWDDLVEREVERLQGVMGEAAFDSSPGYPARLKETYNGKTGERVVRLTKEGVADLEDTEGSRWFRKVEDGKEFLVRILRTRDGNGRVVFKASWFGGTRMLSEEGLEDERRELEALKGGVQGDLFEGLQKSEDSRLRRLEHARDSLPLAEHIFRKFGGEGVNPVHFRASELWDAVLKCGDSPDRLARVRGALRALRELEFRMDLSEHGESVDFEGSVLSNIVFHSKGTEDPRDGDFYLSISPAVIGGLRVFEVPGNRIRDLREVTSFEWRKKLTKPERKALAGYRRGVTRLAVPFYAAAGLTDSQSALSRFLEGNLTRKKDPIQGHRKPLKRAVQKGEGDDPRPYGHDFCPLIPKGTVYSAALGGFRPSPESGWTLAGTATMGTKTGGGHAGGLLSHMGLPYPPGGSGAVRRASLRTALEDLHHLVEEVLGGLVAARWEGKWLTLADARKLPESDLSRKVKFYPFLPLDLAGKMHEIIEADNEKVFRWKVKPSSHAPALVPEVVVDDAGAFAASEVMGLEGAPLWIRLRVARAERKLSQAKVAAFFGVTQQALARWETEEDTERKPIPAELAPLVQRWVETGEVPTADELAARRTRRTGGKRTSG